ncbi:MetQ/NlpA family ABC transporter substrate-binding protein [Auritidibacter ignavus]|uniref:MetQ/NlpA family ABC transporter substrate-binding protein n=1 Tax=Auritidibacter ignavus TaxID=678932 RepID=UPI0024B8CC91|nr:MetQ/NlpA family ABC transporter substrate-binding protein [Auritidibacter ignavus]WHS35752.1 MetQ/NlpA family ABC transporter substrate-binding protein [Auritidibacter ignavus]
MTITMLTTAPRRRWGALGVSLLAGLSLTSCGLANPQSTVDEEQTISMIVTESAPFQEPTEIVKDQLEEEGWTLETTYVTDIVLPNKAVTQGEYDVNFFQHQAFLRQFNQDNGTDVEPLFSVNYAHSGIFSEKYETLDELPEGATVAIPVDTSNNGRALKLLAEGGLIEVDESKDVTALSQQDITANPKDIEFVEIDQQSLGQSLPDVDAGFGFVRLIAEAGYDVEETALILGDDPEVEFPFTDVVAAKPEFRDTEAAQVLQEAYQSEEVQQWYEDYLGGGVVAPEDTITVGDSAQKWEEFTSGEL